MALVLKDEFDSLKLQFYVISGVLGFLIIVLIAVTINLHIKVYSRRRDDDEDDDVSEPEIRKRPPPPPVNSTITLPKPNLHKNWRDTDAEIRRQNNEQENRIPKPALSKSWNAFPGRNRPQFDDDNLSNNSYDRSPVSKNSGSALRNPLSSSITNELESRFDFSENRSNKSRYGSRSGGHSSHLHGGNDNYGFNRNQSDRDYY